MSLRCTQPEPTLCPHQEVGVVVLPLSQVLFSPALHSLCLPVLWRKMDRVLGPSSSYPQYGHQVEVGEWRLQVSGGCTQAEPGRRGYAWA